MTAKANKLLERTGLIYPCFDTLCDVTNEQSCLGCAAEAFPGSCDMKTQCTVMLIYGERRSVKDLCMSFVGALLSLAILIKAYHKWKWCATSGAEASRTHKLGKGTSGAVSAKKERVEQ